MAPSSFLEHIRTVFGTLHRFWRQFELLVEPSSFAEQRRTEFGMLLASVGTVNLANEASVEASWEWTLASP